jgi:hypothetical protein
MLHQSSFFNAPTYSPLIDLHVSVWCKQQDGFDVFLGRCDIPLLSLSDKVWQVSFLESQDKQLKNSFCLQSEILTCYPLAPRKTDPSSLVITGQIQLRLLYQYPDSWSSVYLGATAYENGDYQQAVNLFSEALRIFPGTKREGV